MVKKLILLLAVATLLLSGCFTYETSSDSVESAADIDSVNTEDKNTANQEINYQMASSEENKIPVNVYSIGESFDQGGVITTVKDIWIYPDEEDVNYNIIQFNLLVRNNSDNDVYMFYDVSPIVLNTGEQVDDTDECAIHRVFKAAVKEGVLIYKVKSSVESIETIRWIVTSPLHNNADLESQSQMIATDWDFTFNLDDYAKSIKYAAYEGTANQ